MTKPTLHQVTTTYNRWGASVRVERKQVGEFETLRAAFEADHAMGRTTFPDAITSVAHEVHDESGTRVFLTELYIREHGRETYEAQLADPHFSINLDLWLVDPDAAFAASYQPVPLEITF